MLDAYVDGHRRTLLKSAEDPGMLFVKTGKRTADAAYDRNSFYEAWRLVIQHYGIRNSYTGRGAIAGLLPHGPHNVRDVLATHILKQTGSYETLIETRFGELGIELDFELPSTVFAACVGGHLEEIVDHEAWRGRGRRITATVVEDYPSSQRLVVVTGSIEYQMPCAR